MTQIKKSDLSWTNWKPHLADGEDGELDQPRDEVPRRGHHVLPGPTPPRSGGIAVRTGSDGTRRCGGTSGTPVRRVSEQFPDDDREEQELDEVEGESRGGYDVVEVPLGGDSSNIFDFGRFLIFGTTADFFAQALWTLTQFTHMLFSRIPFGIFFWQVLVDFELPPWISTSSVLRLLKYMYHGIEAGLR